MTEILLSGSGGNMGRAVREQAEKRSGCHIAAGIDVRPGDGSFPVFDHPDHCTVPADVVIDFSHPSLLEPLLGFALRKRLPLVLCTTGLTKEQIGTVRKAAEEIPLFFSANMSLGINVLLRLCQMAAKAFEGQYDIEIVERHHNQKVDAPSGTALLLADGISSVLREEPQYVYDRHSARRKRGKEEVGIHSVRGGTIVGEHEVLFAGPDEEIRLIHRAQSKAVFASGALNAAVFLNGKAPGLYDMGDLLNQSAG